MSVLQNSLRACRWWVRISLPGRPRIVMSDAHRRVVQNLVPSGDTLKGIVGLLVSVKKGWLETAELKISGAPHNCAGIGKGTGQARKAKIELGERLGIFIRALRKMEHGQLRALLEIEELFGRDNRTVEDNCRHPKPARDRRALRVSCGPARRPIPRYAG